MTESNRCKEKHKKWINRDGELIKRKEEEKGRGREGKTRLVCISCCEGFKTGCFTSFKQILHCKNQIKTLISINKEINRH